MNSKQSKLLEALLHASKELNLFSAGDREKLGEKHIPDALAILPFWSFASGSKILDLGTGGGLPGLPLALEKPNCSFTLCDARQKKCTAIDKMILELELENAQTLSGRFEDLAHERAHRGQYEGVLARAVAPLPVLLEYAVGFLKNGGKLYAWKGKNYKEELTEAKNAMKLLNLKLEAEHPYLLPTGEERALLCFIKEGKLDKLYPRKAGAPSRKPL